MSPKLTKQFFPTLVLFLVSLMATGQSLRQYIPSDAPVVLNFNLKNLNDKVNIEQLQQYDFYQELLKEMDNGEMDEAEREYKRTLLQAPESLGFDIFQPFYLFVQQEGDYTFITMVMKLNDRSRYERGLKNLHAESYDRYLVQKDSYQFWQDSTNTYAWNDQVVVYVSSEYTPSFDSYEDSWGMEETAEPYEWPEEEIIYEDSIEIVDEPVDIDVMEEPQEGWDWEDMPAETEEWDWAGYSDYDPEQKLKEAEWTEKVISRSFSSPISSFPKYGKAVSNSRSDVHLWVDYQFMMEAFNQSGAMAGGMGGGEMAQAFEMMQGFMDVFYTDTYMSAGLSFEDGKMAMRYELFYNDDMARFYRGALDARFNKKFFRYIEGGDQLFGYYAVNLSVKNIIDEGKVLMHKALRSTEGYGQMMDDAASILGIFIDEEAIGNLLKGDLLIAISGMQTIPVTETTYDMDEDFNFIPRDTTVLKTLPVFTMLASYGSEKDLMKFVRLGIHSKVLVQEGNFYRMSVPEMGMDIYLALQKGILILSNNKPLITNHLQKGISKKRRLGKKHRKLLCENGSVMYWDIPNTLRALNDGSPGDNNTGPMAYVNMLGGKFSSIQITSAKEVDDSVKGAFDFNFRDKKTNSLEQFFNFMNDIYLEYIGGAKI